MKINIEIPGKLNDLKLWQYQKFAELTSKKDISQDFINRKSLEIFYGIDAKYFEKMKIAEIEMLINALNKVLEVDAKFQNRFSLNGVDYGFIPNLDEMTFGEFVDIDSYIEISNNHKLMSILFRPVLKTFGKHYEIEPYKGTNDDLKQMPLGVALGAIAFFFDLGRDLLTNILKSLKEVEAAHNTNQIFQKNGAGSHQSIHSAMAILKDAMKLRIPTSINV